MVGVQADVYHTLGDIYPYYRCPDTYHIPRGVVPGGKVSPAAGKYVVNDDDYDLYHVLSSAELAIQCNQSGIEPIVGANVIPNSPPDHCLKYLSKDELIMRRTQIKDEMDTIRNTKARFWTHQSMWQRSEFQRLGMSDVSNCRQLSNGVDTELFDVKDEYYNEIIWSGRKWWPKGYWIFEKIIKELPDERFRIFSNDALDITAPNVKTVMGLNHYQIAPRLDGKMLVCTSTTENEPLAILEAYSCGIPVIASNVSGIPEIVSEETGILCDVDKPEEFVQAVKLLNEDESLRSDMGRAARKFVEGKFSLECMGKNAKKLYEEAGV